MQEGKCGDRQRVHDIARRDQAADFAHRDHHDFGFFVAKRYHPLDLAHVLGEEREADVALDCGIRMHLAELDDRVGIEARLLDHLAPRRMHRRRILGIDHSARHLEREFRDAVTPLANHHDVAVFRERDDIHPVGRVENEEVALAAPRMRRAPPIQIENRRAVSNVAPERLPLARLHRKF